MNRYIIYLFFLCSGLPGFSQKNHIVYNTISKEEGAALLKEVNKWYSTEYSYSVTLIHASYAGHNNATPYEQSRGYFKKYPTGYHSCILNVHSIQNKSFLLTIDSSKKLIILNNPSSNYHKNNLSIDDYIKLLDKCTTLKMAGKDDDKILRLEFDKRHPVAAYELYTTKEGMIKGITIFYADQVKSKEGNKVKPKLTIRYENYKKNISPGKSELNETQYITINDRGEAKLTEAYKDFSLIDQRYKTNNP